VAELAKFAISDTTPELPDGDGHPVIVYPGFLGSDINTYMLRNRLRALGYDVHGWEQGQNLGLQRNELSEARSQLIRVCQDAGRPASLFGWSLGGLIAREVAKRRPDCVRQIITAGTPCRDLRATNAWKTYERVNDHPVDDVPLDTDFDELPPVPVTAIISGDDGIVARNCMDIGCGTRHESIEITGTHVGLVWSHAVLDILADRLAQPEGRWTPYAAPGMEERDAAGDASRDDASGT
jgi:pimeloyl-ACP methyl ester carboxylesterase